MKSGYNISWTSHALNELDAIISYLESNWTEKEIKRFARKLEQTIELISKNPAIFQASSDKADIRRAVILKHLSLYYRTKNKRIEILSLFDNRQDPEQKNL